MFMKLGLCLTGGGAKGAFQGGIIKGLYENNIIPDVLTGTSIGAINTYFMINGCYEELEKFWNEIDLKSENVKSGWVIDNSQIIDELFKLSGQEKRIKAAYVNYVSVKDKKISEAIVDLKSLSREDAINAVKYSSLLPSRPEDDISKDKTDNSFDTGRTFNNFKEDLENGIYEGYNLDGGILNNNLLTPLINEGVDKVIIIGLNHKYTSPEYIYDHYQESDVIIFKPDIIIQPTDTIRFQRTFCSDLYSRGYKLSSELVQLKLNIKASGGDSTPPEAKSGNSTL